MKRLLRSRLSSVLSYCTNEIAPPGDHVTPESRLPQRYTCAERSSAAIGSDVWLSAQRRIVFFIEEWIEQVIVLRRKRILPRQIEQRIDQIRPIRIVPSINNRIERVEIGLRRFKHTLAT